MYVYVVCVYCEENVCVGVCCEELSVCICVLLGGCMCVCCEEAVCVYLCVVRRIYVCTCVVRRLYAYICVLLEGCMFVL